MLFRMLSSFHIALSGLQAASTRLAVSAGNVANITARRPLDADGNPTLETQDAGGYFDFGSRTTMDPTALVQMVQNESQTYRLQGAHRLQFRMDLSDTAMRFTEVEKLLDRLAAGGVKNKALG